VRHIKTDHMHQIKQFLTILFIAATQFTYGQANSVTDTVKHNGIEEINRTVQKKDSSVHQEGIKDYLEIVRHIDFFSVQHKSELTIQEFKGLDIIKGKVYFAGAGFPYVVLVEIREGSGYLPYYSCTNGTKIGLENCILRNQNGTFTIPISKGFIIHNTE